MEVTQAAIEQAKILKVEAFDGKAFGITLKSGHSILLELETRSREAVFVDLLKSGEFYRPFTDGQAICWPSGVRITLEEILAMLLSSESTVQK